MSDLISRQAAIDTLADMHCKSDEDGYVWIIRSDAWARIDALPSAEPERKTGRWIDGMEYVNSHWKVCSVCHASAHDSAGGDNYCPNCGAKMECEEDA